ncbi:MULTISPECIES: hypothetical protein [Massilia]|jgi:hypothetical protein|uniref:Uncharacterized protein n=2 Tax=Massilia TaxID=149698 RepID=A0A7X3K6D6_9BURK|nr:MULTISPECIES: hypothetical protein [Telluria group]KQY16175.1 hypothetical protein ASD28_22240 [Massilia sp. Root133]MDN4042559.1 hypothetical protein [Massilia sp. YIM B02787]MVW59779.1 hypothetical protein [Telluria cellulosilytica]
MKFGMQPGRVKAHLHLSHIHRPHFHMPHMMHRDWHAFEPVLRVAQIILLVVLALPFAQFVAKTIVWAFRSLFG